MFSSSRGCLRQKLQPRRLLTPEPKPSEPLLFLYPSWFRNISRPLHQAAVTAPNTADTSQDRETPADKEEAAGSGGVVPVLRKLFLKRRPAPPVITPRRVQSKVTRKVAGTSYVDEPGRSSPWTRAGRAARVRKFKPDPGQWAAAPRLLSRLMGKNYLPVGGEVNLEEQTIFELTGSFEENAWVAEFHSGCEIRVLPRSRNTSSRKVELRGEPRAVELTKQHLLRFQNSKRDGSLPTPTVDKNPLIRRKLSRTKRFHEARRNQRADQIELPSTWTVRSFADYVEDLVTTKVPMSISRELYERTTTHSQTIVQTLEKLFSDPAMAPHLSLRALNYGLQFTNRHTGFTSTPTVLESCIRQRGITFNTQIFNSIIQRAVQSNDFDLYRRTLEEMKFHRIRPNGSTWATLLQVQQVDSIREAIVGFARKSRLLNDIRSKRDMSRQLVSVEFGRCETKSKFVDFIKLMDRILGDGWMSTRIVDAMLQICMKRKMPQLVHPVLELAGSRNAKIGPTTLMRLFNWQRQQGYLREALELQKSFVARLVGRDDAFIIPSLFALAWRKESFNVCRVLWHYAASRGLITRPMENKVIQSHHQSQSSRHRVPGVGGKVVMGREPCVFGFSEHLIGSFAPSPPLESLLQTYNESARETHHALVKFFVSADSLLWQDFEPMRRTEFETLIELAFERDISWRTSGFLAPSNMSYLFDNIIQIELARSHHPPGGRKPPVHKDIATASQDVSSYDVEPLGQHVLLEAPPMDLISRDETSGSASHAPSTPERSLQPVETEWHQASDTGPSRWPVPDGLRILVSMLSIQNSLSD